MPCFRRPIVPLPRCQVMKTCTRSIARPTSGTTFHLGSISQISYIWEFNTNNAHLGPGRQGSDCPTPQGTHASQLCVFCILTWFRGQVVRPVSPPRGMFTLVDFRSHLVLTINFGFYHRGRSAHQDRWWRAIHGSCPLFPFSCRLRI